MLRIPNIRLNSNAVNSSVLVGLSLFLVSEDDTKDIMPPLPFSGHSDKVSGRELRIERSDNWNQSRFQ